MLELHGHVVRYPWGTRDAIPTMIGLPVDGRPVAEFWLGAHPLGPSQVKGEPLDAAIDHDPSLLGEQCLEAFGPRLPFLMKVLSARHALSVQAHPSRTQAEEGFERETAAGVPLNSPTRTYKDAWPKPEILVALDEFHTLAGFREAAASYGLFERLGVMPVVSEVVLPLLERRGEAGFQEVFLDVLSLTGERRSIVDEVLAAAVKHRGDEGDLGEFARTALELDEAFPADPGILAALLLNRVVLSAGQAMYVPEGMLHSHLRGTGIEVMANSDNVVRGCLTDKHVAVDELMRIVDFAPHRPVVMAGIHESAGVREYPTGCEEFSVWRVEPEPAADLPADGLPRIAFVVRGTATFADPDAALVLPQGGAVFVPASNGPVTVSGDADVFVTAPGLGRLPTD